MRCDHALAVHLQGEMAQHDEARAARRHIASCPRCASTVDLSTDPVREPSTRDVGSRAMDRVDALAGVDATRPARHPRLRLLLGGLAAVQLVIALPWLVGANLLGTAFGEVDPSHLTRDGALGVFLAAAGLTVALRPRYAMPALIICAAGLAVQVILGVIDEDRSHVAGWFEAVHLLALAIVAVIAVFAGSRTRAVGPPQRGALRAVGRPDEAD